MEDGGRKSSAGAREREEGRWKREEEQTQASRPFGILYLLAGGATTSSSLYTH